MPPNGKAENTDMSESTVPPPGAKTPGFSIDLPRASRQAVFRTVAGLAAAALGAFGAFRLAQNRLQTVAVSVKASVASKVPTLSAEKSGRITRDIFFSNFAEARLPDFGAAELSAADQAGFAMWHAQINAPDHIETDAATGKRQVSAGWVARITEKYLGDALPGDTPHYLPPTVKPVQTIPFARVESWKPLAGVKGDRFAVVVRVYDPPVDWKLDPYTWTMSNESAPDAPRLVGRWGATVRRVPGGYDPPFRYVLLSWKRI